MAMGEKEERLLEELRKKEPLQLFGFWYSPFVSVVVHVLRQAQLPFDLVRCSPYSGAAQSEEHKKRNPLLKVPALVHGQRSVFETQAIVRYLGRHFPHSMASVFGREEAQDAEAEDMTLKVDELTEAVNALLQGPGLLWIVIGHYAPHPSIWGWTDMSQECKVVRVWLETMVYHTLDRISQAFLASSSSPFLLATPRPTLPDIVLYHFLRLLLEFGDGLLSHEPEIPQGFKDELFARHPKLSEHYQAMSQTPEARFIIEQQARERPVITQELFQEFRLSFGPGLDFFKQAIQQRLSA